LSAQDNEGSSNWGDPDLLSAKQQFVVVIRLLVEAEGRFSGALVDPLSQRQQQFSEPAALLEAVRCWIGEALNDVQTTTRQPIQRDLDD
jgi:hypothetical protein